MPTLTLLHLAAVAIRLRRPTAFDWLRAVGLGNVPVQFRQPLLGCLQTGGGSAQLISDSGGAFQDNGRHSTTSYDRIWERTTPRLQVLGQPPEARASALPTTFDITVRALVSIY